MIGRPAPEEYAPFYAAYVARVPADDALAVLERQPDELRALAAAVPAARETHAYAAGKWTIRELFGHLADTERVFGFRAFCFSRGERAALPGFDENEYMARAPYAGRPLEELVRELCVLREGSLHVLRRLDDAGWRQVGTANASAVSVRALAFILAGHMRHHLGVLRERYGVGG